jgi:glycosyltransferase involved in cell wall biosynthesis
MTGTRKIVYLIGSMRRGGAEGQVVHLLRHFNEGAWRSSLYLLNETGEHLDEVRRMGIHVKGFGFEKRYSSVDPRNAMQVMATVSQIGVALQEDKPDILHCFLDWANVLGAMAGRRAGVPQIVTSRRSLSEFKHSNRWMRPIENWTNRHVSAVTVNSRAVLEQTLAAEKIDRRKLHLLYNGVEFGALCGEEKICRTVESLGLESARHEGADFILCVANLIHYKGHLRLLDAFADLLRAHPKTMILLVGRDGGMEGSIREKAQSLGIVEKVKLLGMQPDVGPLYAAADAVVLASDEEGFSNVILEAMAAGKAIVATKVGGIPEAIENEVHGLLVPPRDEKQLAQALIRVIGDRGLRARLGTAARERARSEFSLEAMFRSYETFYGKLLAEAPSQ